MDRNLCDTVVAGLSARLDGEDLGVDPAVVDAHLQTCPDCAEAAAGMVVLHRRARLRPADPVPDRTAAILDAVGPLGPTASLRRPDRTRPAAGEAAAVARRALGAVALLQLVLLTPMLVWGGHHGSLHMPPHLSLCEPALALAWVLAALQPRRADGLLPLAAALTTALGATAVADVVGGSTSILTMAHPVVDLAGVAALWALARATRTGSAGTAGTDPVLLPGAAPRTV